MKILFLDDWVDYRKRNHAAFLF